MDDLGKVNDVFFDCGIKNLRGFFIGVEPKVYEKIIFIYFHTTIIRHLLSLKIHDSAPEDGKKIIIITTAAMKPVAMYYYARFMNVSAVLDASEPIENIVKMVSVSCFSGQRCFSKRFKTKALTAFEFDLLTLIVNGSEIWQVAERLDISKTNAYRYIRAMCQKMGFQKIVQLKFAVTLLNK